MPKPTKAQSEATSAVLQFLQSPAGKAQLEKVQAVPSGRGGPAALIGLAVTTSGNENIIAAWAIADQKKVMVELVKPN